MAADVLGRPVEPLRESRGGRWRCITNCSEEYLLFSSESPALDKMLDDNELVIIVVHPGADLRLHLINFLNKMLCTLLHIVYKILRTKMQSWRISCS